MRFCFAALTLLVLAACNPSAPTTTAAPGASAGSTGLTPAQQSQRDFYRGPRGGATGR